MKFKNILLMCMIVTGFSYAKVSENNAIPGLTAEFTGSEGNQELELDALIKKIDSIGYSTVAATKNIQAHYNNKFKEKNVEMISFFSITNKEKMRPLLIKNPDFGAYAPFNFLAYKTLDIENDDHTWYGHLAANTMLDIIGEKDESTREEFREMIKPWDTLVNKELKPIVSHKFEHTKPLPVHGLTKMVKKFDQPEDLDDFIEEFIGDHDGRFAKKEFIIAGFIDFKFEYDDMELEFEEYDAYWVSLLCHFEFSNSIFNRGIPEAGMFAPCSVYFYIPKGKNELHVGYANINNWVNAMNFTDKERIEYMRSIDAEVVGIFEELGFEMEVQAMPVETKVPVVAKVPATATISVDTKDKEIEALKSEVAKLKAVIQILTK
jgi:uncharacterized protein (DUF302 family)